MNKSVDEVEWEVLYHALCDVCKEHGKEDPYCNGDYWIVDDCWGGITQKLIVFSPSFLTPRMVNQISKGIKETGLLGGQVVVAFDFGSLNIELEPMGIIIDSHEMIEQWNLDEIRKRVGQNFYRDD